MTFDIKIRSIIFLWLLSFSSSFYAQSSPQPGQNLWNLIASIGINIDLLTQCSPVPITASGTTISQPGTYCLTTDLSDGGNITIAASNVYLDLSAHTISNVTNSAIKIASGMQHIIVNNGSINNCTHGVTTEIFANNIGMNNLNIFNTSTGIECKSTSTIILSDIQVTEFVDFAISLTDCTHATIQNSAVQNINQTGTTPSYGYYIENTNTPIGSLIVTDCTATGNLRENSVGFYILNPLNDNRASIQIYGCQSSSFSHCFQFVAVNVPIVCKDCIASFAASQTIDSMCYNIECSNSFFENCIAAASFIGFGSANGSMTNCTLKNCSARSANRGFDLATIGTRNVIQDCIATGNFNVGFNILQNSNNALFCFNSGIFNLVNNFSNMPGGLSSPITAISSGARQYGDNLANI